MSNILNGFLADEGKTLMFTVQGCEVKAVFPSSPNPSICYSIKRILLEAYSKAISDGKSIKSLENKRIFDNYTYV